MAKAAAVSRQAVSLWFAADGDFRTVHVANLLNLSDGLGIAPAELLVPLPELADRAEERRLYAEFCWDRSYPDIYRFLTALAAGRPRAVARLTRAGIYEAPRYWGHRYGTPIPISARGCRPRGAPWSMPYGDSPRFEPSLAVRVLPPSLLSGAQARVAQRVSGCMLVGGTALAGFYAGHRRSDDLDLFTGSSAAFRQTVLAVRTLQSLGVELQETGAQQAILPRRVPAKGFRVHRGCRA